MRIHDILATKGTDVAAVPLRTTIADAVAELAKRDIGALVVSDDGIRVDGIVSERDVVRQLGTDQDHLLDRPVSSIMSSPVHTCEPEDSVESVMATMTNHRVRHVPVVRGDQLSGLVSIGDVVKSRIEELQRDHQILVEYITAR